MINDELLTSGDASAVETGAVELSRLFVLGECVRIASALPPKSCHRRVLDLNGKLMEGLRDLNADLLTPTADHERAGIVSVRKDNAEEWLAWSAGRDVVISQRGPDVLRFSLHFFNNEDDIEGLMEAWREGP